MRGTRASQPTASRIGTARAPARCTAAKTAAGAPLSLKMWSVECPALELVARRRVVELFVAAAREEALAEPRAVEHRERGDPARGGGRSRRRARTRPSRRSARERVPAVEAVDVPALAPQNASGAAARSSAATSSATRHAAILGAGGAAPRARCARARRRAGRGTERARAAVAAGARAVRWTAGERSRVSDATPYTRTRGCAAAKASSMMAGARRRLTAVNALVSLTAVAVVALGRRRGRRAVAAARGLSPTRRRSRQAARPSQTRCRRGSPTTRGSRRRARSRARRASSTGGSRRPGAAAGRAGGPPRWQQLGRALCAPASAPRAQVFGYGGARADVVGGYDGRG